ncbi:MAG: DUF983 domain-containing protein [Gemmatimonadaceae bacterium]|nr:DUF983 domain-containing protein [Gemmatimonadaceae bacterium]
MALPTTPPSPGRRIARALALHCPECGSGGLFRRWLFLQPRCPSCALRLDRANPDHFVGAYLVNLIAAELLFAIGFGLWLLAVWPEVPWDRIEVVAVVAMLLAPLVVYPFTRTVWLAADLIFDPPKASDR